jgi:hypothetical protein
MQARLGVKTLSISLAATLLGSTAAHGEPPPLAPGGGATPPDKEACAAAYEQAQVFRKHDKLVEARKKLIVCAQDSCPKIAQEDCGRWFVEVEASLPTVVIEAKDPTGRAIEHVRVAADGEPLTDKLDGTALPMNPGSHKLHCEFVGAAPVDLRVLVLEGKKNQLVPVAFEDFEFGPTPLLPPPPPGPAPVPREAAPARRVPTAAYVLAGVALVGAAGFAYFGLRGVSDENSLRSSCAPTCASSDVDAIRSKYRVADVSLAVGVISAGLAAWLYLSSRGAHSAGVAARLFRGSGGTPLAFHF